jgi:hypothetical protein
VARAAIAAGAEWRMSVCTVFMSWPSHMLISVRGRWSASLGATESKPWIVPRLTAFLDVAEAPLQAQLRPDRCRALQVYSVDFGPDP